MMFRLDVDFCVILFNFRLNEREANPDKPRNDLGAQDQDIPYEPVTNVPGLKHQFCLLSRESFFSRASFSSRASLSTFVRVWVGTFLYGKE